MRLMIALPLLALSLAACKDPGDPCVVVRGKDPCGIKCLNLPMNCPDGVYHVNPEVCSGGRCADDTDCAAGFVCMAFEHDERLRHCTPASVCE